MQKQRTDRRQPRTSRRQLRIATRQRSRRSVLPVDRRSPAGRVLPY